MNLQIQPLSPERLNDWLEFMEGPVFPDNQMWSSCYCAFNCLDHNVIVWANRGAADNRRDMCQWIESGHAQGWLAYRESVVVGWLNGAPRARYPSNSTDHGDDLRTGKIV